MITLKLLPGIILSLCIALVATFMEEVLPVHVVALLVEMAMGIV